MTQEVDTWSYREGNFLRWPRRRTGEHPRYELNPKGRQVEGGSDLESLRRRVLLTPGFYRLRAGERLLVFRCRTKSGEILDGYVKVGRE